MPKDFLGLGLFALNRGRVSNPQWFTYTQILVDYLPPPFSGVRSDPWTCVSYSHSFFYLPFLKFFMTTLLQLGVNIIFLDILNSASRILQCWPYYVKINYARHQFNTTPKELKTDRVCSHRELFRPLWGSSVWRNNQRKLWWKISAHSDLNPDPEPSTPTESHHTTCLLGRKREGTKSVVRWE